MPTLLLATVFSVSPQYSYTVIRNTLALFVKCLIFHVGGLMFSIWKTGESVDRDYNYLLVNPAKAILFHFFLLILHQNLKELMGLKDIDYFLIRLEELCSSFKQSMFMDHLPYPAAISFKRYLGLIIDVYEDDNNVSHLCYSLDLLRELYILNNPNLLFDKKASSLLSVEQLDDYKSLEKPVYGQTLSYYKIHTNSEKFRLYVDYLQDINKYLSSRLKNYCIYLKEDFSAETKIKAGVKICQIKSVIKLLQELGYIDGDKETADAFISIFEGSALAQQKMKIQWKCKNKKGDSGSTTQNIAALYVLFETLGVDMESASNRKVLEQIFLDSGQLKKRVMSDFLKDFKSQIEKSLTHGHC